MALSAFEQSRRRWWVIGGSFIPIDTDSPPTKA
jgi:hypothetical protein